MRNSYITRSAGQSHSRCDSPQWLRNIWLVLLAAIGCLLAAMQFRGFAFPARQPTVGPRLDVLRLQGLTGGATAVTLGDLKGRVVVLHLWSPWNAASRMQLSYIAELQQQLRSSSDVVVLPVCYGKHSGEDLAVLDYEARLFMQQANINMPCYVDADETTRKAVSRAVGVEVLPLTVVLDGQAVVRRYFCRLQPGEQEQLRKLIIQLVGQ